MEDKSPRRRPPTGVVVALALIALSAGSATAWFTWRSLSPSIPNPEFPELEIEGESVPEGYEAPSANPIEVPDPPANPDVAAEPSPQQGTIYWVSTDGEALALAPAEIDLPPGESPEAALSFAFDDLMKGPMDGGRAATTIPDNTQLLALSVESDGIHVNLSNEFTMGGGSASMIGRLAQVVYTATTLAPDTPVWISVEGQPLTLLGGEGLEVRQPITRQDLARDFGIPELQD